ALGRLPCAPPRAAPACRVVHEGLATRFARVRSRRARVGSPPCVCGGSVPVALCSSPRSFEPWFSASARAPRFRRGIAGGAGGTWQRRDLVRGFPAERRG